MPIASASNSCFCEKLASSSFDLASASAPAAGSLTTSVTTRLTRSTCCSSFSRSSAWWAMTWPISCAITEASSESSSASAIESARHIKLAGRQRESVDRLRIEDGDFVMQVGLFRRRDQAFDHLLDHASAAAGRYRRRHRSRGCADARAAPPATCRCRPVWPAPEARASGASAGGEAVQAASSERRERDARLAQPVACDAQSSPSHHVTQIGRAIRSRRLVAIRGLDLLRTRRLDRRAARACRALR